MKRNDKTKINYRELNKEMQEVVRKSVINYIKDTYRNEVRDRIVRGWTTLEEANKYASHGNGIRGIYVLKDGYGAESGYEFGDGIIGRIEDAIGVSVSANDLDSHIKNPYRIDRSCSHYIHRAIYDILEREIVKAYRDGVRDAARVLEGHNRQNAKDKLVADARHAQALQSDIDTVLKDIEEGFYEIKGGEGSIVNGVWSLCPHDGYYDLTYHDFHRRVNDEHLVSLFDKVRKAA